MRPWWKPIWTRPALMRAVRATHRCPGAVRDRLKVIGNPQMTLFATFGGIATLVVAAFGGTWKDKLVGHVGLAIVGSLALIIGTLVSGTAWLAAIVTRPGHVRDLLRRDHRPESRLRHHRGHVRLRAAGRLGRRRGRRF